MANETTYDSAESEFLSAVDGALTSIKNKFDLLTITEHRFSNSEITLKNNSVFVYNGETGVRELHIKYPEGNFIATVLFTTAPDGQINITFDEGTKFVGSASYEFFPNENWELNIHNGRVVGSTIV